jgi:Subtilase family
MRFRPRWRSPIGAIVLLFPFAFIGITAPAVAGASAAPAARTRYLVRFAEPALARYNRVAVAAGQSAPGPIPWTNRANGRLRLDASGAPARSYVDYLRARQRQHLDDIALAIGRPASAMRSMQYALDAVVLMLSPDEALRVAAVSGVAAVDADREFELASDIGPRFTGAESVWWGTQAGVGTDSIFVGAFDAAGFLGDGIVVGVIDTGYNSLSPSFQAVDAGGYRVVNPLGHGTYLGQCNVPGISLGGCNDKVIGVYDEVGLTTTIEGWVYSVEDVQGHGSHTASVAAGNTRRGSLAGYSTPLSGVAPHANLVIYRACSPSTLCAGSAMIASVDQAIADGVVDVLNYSISDTAGPWADPVAQAFLAASEAGIAVVAAGGNDKSEPPAAGSVNNTAPWITTVAASTHTGGAIVQAARTGVQPDTLAAFSLLGPARFNAVKPDLQAPGVAILGATWNDGTGAERIALMDGTSMATAHTTGSIALLLGAHPDWTPLEAKSALMMSASESGLSGPDGVAPSGYFERGSGRVQEFDAARAGLVLDENAVDFANADPTWGDGDPAKLNLASMQDSACKGTCSFSRTFRSTQDHSVTWSVSFVAGPAPSFTAVSSTPRQFTVGAHAYSTVKFSAKGSSLPADGQFHFAEAVLLPDDTRLSPLHLTIAVAAP